ncbi:peptidoglycan-binding protein [Paractinoplanes brasiliensis]|uniref:HlyD family secretion protein n=1 Tax=Paractinoplanes brasiliensis TaxID=52695 RepID=A0A4R6JPM3_9ACTN|nr:peptidoglycan-binding protein [Actinoplanes brasiliensis]TDO38249.1 HlyD family secretion protein [Actinoplanes brasiliensis]GID26974.1 peptidoglycan-binding protein [Actinoplanes brasiliensis]
MNRRRTTGVVAGVLTIGAVAAAVTVINLPAAESGDSTTGSGPAETAEITKQTLIDRESHDGTLGHGDTSTVAARGSGTLTALPASGAVITRGKPLYRLDNRPVTLLYGTLPAYRTLRPGVEGADVLQFEKNLRALGYKGFTVDDEYTSATAEAVEQWQDDLGRRATGRVESDQIAYAKGQVRVDSLSAEVGAVVQPGAELLKTTGTTMVATVRLDVDDQRLARKGATVEVEMPDGAGVPGKITAVETVVEPGQGNEEDTTKIEVTIGFARTPEGLDEAAVAVGFVASQRADVLTVPVAALLALAEGGYGLEIVESGATRIVPVGTGLFADGRVEVSGEGIRAGLKVGMPS